MAVLGEFEFDVVEAGGGAVLDGHEYLPFSPAQVQIGVTPGMEFGRPPQGLARACGGALAGVMDEHDGGGEAALEVAQEGEDCHTRT